MKLKKKWFIIIPLVVIVSLFVVLYYFFGKDQNSFTATDRKWIEEQKNKVIDFYVPNNYPIYSGNGVFNTFINNLKESTGLDFNVVLYEKEEKLKNTNKEYKFKILDNKDKLSKNDLLLQEDIYVIFGKSKGIYNSLKDITGTIGVLANDSDEMTYYLKSYSNIKLKVYDKVEILLSDYENNKIDKIILCNNMYLDKTINKEMYNIKHVFTEFTKKIVFSLNEEKNMDRMNKIFIKYYNNWKKNKYLKIYNDSILEHFFNNYKDINDKTKTEFLTKTYTYGYVPNKPYEKVSNNKIYGIAGEYINRVLRLSSSLSINFKKYNTIEELKKAIDDGDIDIYFNYFNYENPKFTATNSSFIEKYVVLGKIKDNYIINSFESMKGLRVSILNNNSVYNFFKDNSKAILSPEKTISSLLKNCGSNLIVLDKEVYEFYKHDKFSNYEVLFESNMTNEYKFMINNDQSNKILYDVFNYIINTNSYFNFRNRGLNSLNMSIWEANSFQELYVILLILTLGPILLLMILYLTYKNRKKIKNIRKEEKRKYIDMLTSLKNRNYLNYNMNIWNKSKKYPQSVIIVDLNNVKYVNDNYGHSEGDRLIIEAAGILINAQLENSEIIRTDGNEFLIYLVGYSDQQVSTYAKKLAKEFKNLPYQFGAAIGYSMILDEIKTIDDAINEAILAMKKNKDDNR